MGSSSSTGRRRGNTSSNNSSSSYPATRNRRAGASSASTYPGQHQQNVQHDTRWVNNNTSTASSSAPTPIGNGRVTTPTNRINTNSRGRDTRNSSNNTTSSAATSSSVGASTTVSGSNSSSNNATTLSRPGAYSISREGAGPTQVFRVQIPSEVRPGQEFQVSVQFFFCLYIHLQI